MESTARFAAKNFLLSLFDIAFRSRHSLPLIISAGFMLFDFHLRLEVDVEAGINNQDDEDEETDEEQSDDDEG